MVRGSNSQRTFSYELSYTVKALRTFGALPKTLYFPSFFARFFAFCRVQVPKSSFGLFQFLLYHRRTPNLFISEQVTYMHYYY